MQKKYLYWLILLPALGFLGAVFLPRLMGPEKDVFIPISFENVPAGLIVSSPSANGLEIRLRGSQSEIATLLKAPPAYRMDLSDVKAGLATIAIQPETLSLPWRVSIIRSHPDSITLKLEKRVTKTLPVSAVVVGKPMAGYQATHLDTHPKQIRVSGPEKVLGPLTRAPTKPIDINNTFEILKKEIGLDLPESVEVIGESKFVIAEVIIEEKVIVMTIKDMPVKWRHTPHAVTITPPVITIEVKGTEMGLANMEEKHPIDVFVDLEGLSPGVYVRRATVDLPIGTTLAGASPELFTVSLKKQE